MRTKRYLVNTTKIKHLLLDKHLKLVNLADQIGEGRCIVSHVVHGIRYVPRIRKKIARALGVPEEEIFPKAHQAAA